MEKLHITDVVFFVFNLFIIGWFACAPCWPPACIFDKLRVFLAKLFELRLNNIAGIRKS